MNVDVFKKSFQGGSRPNRFAVTGWIGGPQIAILDNVLVRAASMPSVTVGIMRVPFRGRIVKVPGDRTYEEWTFTMYDDFEPHEFRNNFLAWNEAFNLHEDNIPGPLFAQTHGIDLLDIHLFTEFQIHQLDMNGNVARTVELNWCWPTVVGELVLNYDSADTISEYTVTLAYDYLNDDPQNVGAGFSQAMIDMHFPDPNN